MFPSELKFHHSRDFINKEIEFHKSISGSSINGEAWEKGFIAGMKHIQNELENIQKKADEEAKIYFEEQGRKARKILDDVLK